MSSNSLLTVRQLEHSFSGTQFKLGPIDLQISAGQCIGIMGQNGAGKSTFFQILTGNLKPQRGEVQILQQAMRLDNFYLKRQVGYLPQNLELPKWVCAYELLSYASSLYGLQDQTKLVHEVLEYWDCLSFAHKPIGTCSHGMKKRVALGLANIHSPALLILDEPFSGLDLYHIKALNDIIKKRKTEGKPTILCTHIAPYIANLSNSVYTLISGQLRELENWQSQSFMERINTIEQAFYFGT